MRVVCDAVVITHVGCMYAWCVDIVMCVCVLINCVFHFKVELQMRVAYVEVRCGVNCGTTCTPCVCGVLINMWDACGMCIVGHACVPCYIVCSHIVDCNRVITQVYVMTSQCTYTQHNTCVCVVYPCHGQRSHHHTVDTVAIASDMSTDV